jgi:TFIIF-interacting CTD phosphatase-like protein
MRHTIVLDLDETLVHSVDDMSILTDLGILSNPKYLDLRSRIFTLKLDNVLTKPGSGSVHEMWGIIRPHTRDFLIFCFRYFNVVVWTAGQRKYALAIVKILFKDIGWPHQILSREDCSQIRNLDDGYYKPLRRILGFNPPKLVDNESQAFDDRGLNHILIVDDRKKNFTLCNPRNGIRIPPFEPDLDIESLRQEDTSLLKLINFLSRPEVILSPDVRTLNKNNIFTPNLFDISPIRYQGRTPIGDRYRSPARKEVEYYLIPTKG